MCFSSASMGTSIHVICIMMLFLGRLFLQMNNVLFFYLLLKNEIPHLDVSGSTLILRLANSKYIIVKLH